MTQRLKILGIIEKRVDNGGVLPEEMPFLYLEIALFGKK